MARYAVIVARLGIDNRFAGLQGCSGGIKYGVCGGTCFMTRPERRAKCSSRRSCRHIKCILRFGRSNVEEIGENRRMVGSVILKAPSIRSIMIADKPAMHIWILQ